MEKKFSLQSVVFCNINVTVLLDKDGTMDNVQKRDIYTLISLMECRIVVMKVSHLIYCESTVMIDKSMMVLQICTDLLKMEPGLSNETCPTSYDENQIIDIKIEEDPVSVTFPAIKVEQEEVSCIYVYVSILMLISQVSRIISFLNSVCLSVHMKQFHSAE
jgi:hypothetical protein